MEKKKKKRKKIVIILVAVIVIALIIGAVSCSRAAGSAAYVTTTKATRGEIQESISTSGLVESEIKKVYFARVGGAIASVNVSAGELVKAGELLMDYELSDMEELKYQASLQQRRSDAVYQEALVGNSDSQSKLNEANHNLGIIEQQIAADKETLQGLQRDLDSAQRGTSNALVGENYNLSVSANDLTENIKSLDPASQEYADKTKQLNDLQKQIQYNQYRQSVTASSDNVASLQQKISDVQENLALLEESKARMESQKTTSENTVMDGYMRTQYEVDNELAHISYKDTVADYDLASEGIRAEFEGIVTECSVIEGATVMEGTQLLTLESSENVKITFSASKRDIEKLSVGQKVDITISGRSYEGEVSKINRMAQANQSGTPMVGAEVHIQNPDDNIILGLDAKLYIYTNHAEDILMVPVEAVNADRDGDFLYVVEDGVIVRKPIICGISSDNYVEIKEGITEEDEIVISALTDIEEGRNVVVMPDVE
ncbi:MAG: efflux RND transporter periplasmic adaptor subunit [Lachnospiraceae bacterium]|nr:efflux RND transporter periplasmic adaptor subunit [Lachnospiraceae bacterium]